MNKHLLAAILACSQIMAYAAVAPAPDGTEWQDVTRLQQGRLPSAATFFSFKDKESARKVLPESSAYVQSLDGVWKFHWVETPDKRPADFWKVSFDVSGWDDIKVPSNWNIAGIQEDGSLKYGTPIYVNVRYPFWYQKMKGNWKGGVMQAPPSHWTMHKDRNEVGSYRRTFTLPKTWRGKDVFIDFDGVDSFFYLWINGNYVGFSKNSRNTARFDVSDYVKSGENVVAVEVYRNSDGSFFEAQDMFRLPGIFRSVRLEAKPRARFTNLRVTPQLGDEGSDFLRIEAEVKNPAKGYSIEYALYENYLYRDDNRLVLTDKTDQLNTYLKLAGAKRWSAEAPYRYTLVASLLDGHGKPQDIISTYVGFRQVCIDETPSSADEFGLAGRYFYLNGKPVKLRGVNRHETEPSMGHAITREVMEKDIMMMKRNNINHVRNSHYPDDPYWYYLCDRYGIYLMDEANLETHPYGYEEESLSHVPEMKAAHVARVADMIIQNYNHPSVIIWSMGNEAGPGENFAAAYSAAKMLDPMRPVQYERNNDYSDIGCRQYPEVGWVANVATGKADVKYPYHINEFAHSMGNALGNFADYWALMDSNNYFMGGCIWDWVDQSLTYYADNAGHTPFLAYGGDFGDTPNDGQFVMNGILFGDRSPKPQLEEVKKVYQPICSSLTEDGKLDIWNRNYFEASDCNLSWSITANGNSLRSGTIQLDSIPARRHVAVNLDLGGLPADAECFLNVSYLQAHSNPWADAGAEIARDQLPLQAGTFKLPGLPDGFVRVRTTDTANGLVTLEGDGFEMKFDSKAGAPVMIKYGDRTVLNEAPVLDVARAFNNNDVWAFRRWFENGLYDIVPTVKDSRLGWTIDGCIRMVYTVEYAAPCGSKISTWPQEGYHKISKDESLTDVVRFTAVQSWTVAPDGSLTLDAGITSSKPGLPLPKIGYRFKIEKGFDSFSYYGRGPQENYSDRQTSAFIGTYHSTVDDEYVDYTKPQDFGNHESVRWVSLSDNSSCGIKVQAKTNSLKGEPVMSASVCRYTPMEMIMAAHPWQLPAKPAYTWLCLDAAVTGLGGNSCGPAPLERDIVRFGTMEFGFRIFPVN